MFQVRAHNQNGWGSFSTPVAIVASSYPVTPATPTTMINNMFVRVTWAAPFNNYESIDQYSIVF